MAATESGETEHGQIVGAADASRRAPEARSGAVALLRTLLAAAVFGVVALVFSISFAAILYGGGTPGLSRGIGLALAGATVMALVGAFSLSWRETLLQPQDITAVILSISVGAIVTGWTDTQDALLATVVVLVAVSTLMTGAAAWLGGRFRLGFLVRFVPYPVIGGFLAATGYLMIAGAMGMALGHTVSLWNLGPLLDPSGFHRWLPWVVYGTTVAVISRRVQHDLMLPGCILLGLAGFYVALWAAGGTLASARDAGLLLGPFPESSLVAGLGPWILSEAHWSALPAHVPTMIAAVGMALIGTLLNASGLEMATGREIDSDRELRGVGIANLAAVPFGGMIGYNILSMTLFARALGLRGPVPGLAVAAVAVGALFFGAGLLSMLPIGIFVGVLTFLGLDLLDTWIRIERRRLPLRDYAIVLVILAVAATVGFLQALAVGLLAAVVLFVIAYSGVDVLRLRTTAAHRRSRVERPEHELARLEQAGERAAIYQLSGYLFFGTASHLVARIQRERAARSEGPRHEIIDFRRVSGIDASAAFALVRLCAGGAAQGIHTILCGAAPEIVAALDRAGLEAGDGHVEVADRLDDALRRLEGRLLAETATGGPPPAGLLEELIRGNPGFDPARYFQAARAAAGDEVVAQGSPPDGMLLLVSGTLRAEFVGADGGRLPVATIRPGTLVGEIGAYARVPRTARVVAEEACELLLIPDAALQAMAEADPRLALDFHRLAAAHLARRLMRTSALLRDADL